MNRTRTIKRLEIKGIMTLLVILLVVCVSFTAAAAQTPPEGGSGADASTEPQDSSRLLQKAEREGSVRAIVGLRSDFIPEGRLSQAQATDQRSAIVSAQAGLQAELQGTGYRTLRTYETVPYIALKMSPQALRAAERSAHVTGIGEDRTLSPSLSTSTRTVQAQQMWSQGVTGRGQVIAVLDTGVDGTHPFFSVLGDKIVEEACFSARSNCPNGTTTQTGDGSAVPCTYATEECKHGTHVAGIAAGQPRLPTNPFAGVARGADIMAVQIFSRFTGATECPPPREDPCARIFYSDVVAGLEWVFAARNTRNIASLNMSFSEGPESSSNCDTTTNPPLAATKAVIDNLRSAGIATVIASGNGSRTGSLFAPACISSAVSVGSTLPDGTSLAPTSNSSSSLSLLAPGHGIRSSVPGRKFEVGFGTSMAAPHVAGAWALLKQQHPAASVTHILCALQDTGKPIADNRAAGGVTKPLIQIAKASAADALPPRVTCASPSGPPPVSVRTNVRATFSKAMQASTINTSTFTLLLRGNSPNVPATVTYDPATNTATLDPTSDLITGPYIATVSTGAQDLAGNSLDQDPNVAGNQPMTWQVKVLSGR